MSLSVSPVGCSLVTSRVSVYHSCRLEVARARSVHVTNGCWNCGGVHLSRCRRLAACTVGTIAPGSVPANARPPQQPPHVHHHQHMQHLHQQQFQQQRNQQHEVTRYHMLLPPMSSSSAPSSTASTPSAGDDDAASTTSSMRRLEVASGRPPSPSSSISSASGTGGVGVIGVGPGGSGTRFRIRLHPRMGRTSGQFVLTGGDKPVTVQYSVGGPPSSTPQSPSPTPLSVQTSAGSSVISGSGGSGPQSPNYASHYHARLESSMTAPAIATPAAPTSPSTTPLSPVRGAADALSSGSAGPRLVKDKPLALHDAGTPPEVVRIPLGEATDCTDVPAGADDAASSDFAKPLSGLLEAPSVALSASDAAGGGRLTSDRPDVLKNLPDTVDFSDDDAVANAAAVAAVANANDKADFDVLMESTTKLKPSEDANESSKPAEEQINDVDLPVKSMGVADNTDALAAVTKIETPMDDSDVVFTDASGDASSNSAKEISNSLTSTTSPTAPSPSSPTATQSDDIASTVTAAGPVVTALLKEADSMRGQDIPKFYFADPNRASASATAADEARLAQALEQLTGQSVSLAQMADIAKAMGYPKFWKQPLFSAAGGTEQRPATKERLTALRRDLARNFRDDESRFVHLLTRGASQQLVVDDFLPLVQDIVDSHPGLSFLQEAPEFHGRYVNTVIARIFYEINASWTGRITCQELRRSKLLVTIASLEVKDDINEVTDFFSYEHFYVIYCKFWDIDTDHDLFISKEDLRRHNNYGRYLLQMPPTSALALAFSLGIPALSDRIIDRIFSGAVSRSKSLLAEGKMSYPEFVWFLLAEEDKKHPRSIEYWFRCMDLDGDGVISLYEMEHFYTEQMRRMEEARIEEYQGLQDCVCTILDMVKPARPNRITLSDLKRCKLAGVFFDTMFNLHKFLDYEQRDPFANQRDIQECAGMSDWEKYAAEMYEILVAEESNGAMHDDGAYPDDFENMEEDSTENYRSTGEGMRFMESFKGSKEI